MFPKGSGVFSGIYSWLASPQMLLSQFVYIPIKFSTLGIIGSMMIVFP